MYWQKPYPRLKNNNNNKKQQSQNNEMNETTEPPTPRLLRSVESLVAMGIACIHVQIVFKN